MNLQQSHTLRRIDERLATGNRGFIETQYGNIWIYPTSTGFIAEYFDSNNVKHIERNTVASVAFMKMADLVKDMNEVALITETVQ